MDGDGLKDIVTGKRFWSHGRTGDPDRNAAAVLYWFKLVRTHGKSVDFVPYLIDNDSGIGTQVVAGDVNGDSLPDVVVGNKKGTFVHLHEKKTGAARRVGEGAAETHRRLTRPTSGRTRRAPRSCGRRSGRRRRPASRRCLP